MVISLEPYDQLRLGFHQNMALEVGHTLQLKTVFSFNASSDSFCLIASYIVSKHLLLAKDFITKQALSTTSTTRWYGIDRTDHTTLATSQMLMFSV